MSCGVGRRQSLDLVLLRLWGRLAAVALMWPSLGTSTSHGSGPKKQKKKKKKKKAKSKKNPSYLLHPIILICSNSLFLYYTGQRGQLLFLIPSLHSPFLQLLSPQFPPGGPLSPQEGFKIYCFSTTCLHRSWDWPSPWEHLILVATVMGSEKGVWANLLRKHSETVSGTIEKEILFLSHWDSLWMTVSGAARNTNWSLTLN